MAKSIRRAAALKALWEAVRGARRPGAPSTSTRLMAFPRMVTMGFTGRYPHLDKRRIGLILVSLLYVVSPVDFVPEIFIPVLGLGDDAVVLAFLVGSVLSETDAFLEWEANKNRTVVGETL